MIIDYHSHILPKMDDGASSSAEALEMLLESKRQGIDVVCATPHFYPDRDFPEAFFSRRQSCYNRLLEVSKGYDVPELKMGAEVAYYYGIGNSDEIENFCYEGTNELLVEMQFGQWNHNVFDDFRGLLSMNIVPVLAHIERYLDWVSFEDLLRLKRDGIKLQCNASCFIEKNTSNMACKWYKEGFIEYIGSDMHNNSGRPQNIAKALEILSE